MNAPAILQYQVEERIDELSTLYSNQCLSYDDISLNLSSFLILFKNYEPNFQLQFNLSIKSFLNLFSFSIFGLKSCLRATSSISLDFLHLISRIKALYRGNDDNLKSMIVSEKQLKDCMEILKTAFLIFSTIDLNSINGYLQDIFDLLIILVGFTKNLVKTYSTVYGNKVFLLVCSDLLQPCLFFFKLFITAYPMQFTNQVIAEVNDLLDLSLFSVKNVLELATLPVNHQKNLYVSVKSSPFDLKLSDKVSYNEHLCFQLLQFYFSSPIEDLSWCQKIGAVLEIWKIFVFRSRQSLFENIDDEDFSNRKRKYNPQVENDEIRGRQELKKHILRVVHFSLALLNRFESYMERNLGQHENGIFILIGFLNFRNSLLLELSKVLESCNIFRLSLPEKYSLVLDRYFDKSLKSGQQLASLEPSTNSASDFVMNLDHYCAATMKDITANTAKSLYSLEIMSLLHMENLARSFVTIHLSEIVSFFLLPKFAFFTSCENGDGEFSLQFLFVLVEFYSKLREIPKLLECFISQSRQLIWSHEHSGSVLLSLLSHNDFEEKLFRTLASLPLGQWGILLRIFLNSKDSSNGNFLVFNPIEALVCRMVFDTNRLLKIRMEHSDTMLLQHYSDLVFLISQYVKMSQIELENKRFDYFNLSIILKVIRSFVSYCNWYFMKNVVILCSDCSHPFYGSSSSIFRILTFELMGVLNSVVALPAHQIDSFLVLKFEVMELCLGLYDIFVNLQSKLSVRETELLLLSESPITENLEKITMICTGDVQLSETLLLQALPTLFAIKMHLNTLNDNSSMDTVINLGFVTAFKTICLSSACISEPSRKAMNSITNFTKSTQFLDQITGDKALLMGFLNTVSSFFKSLTTDKELTKNDLSTRVAAVVGIFPFDFGSNLDYCSYKKLLSILLDIILFIGQKYESIELYPVEFFDIINFMNTSFEGWLRFGSNFDFSDEIQSGALGIQDAASALIILLCSHFYDSHGWLSPKLSSFILHLFLVVLSSRVLQSNFENILSTVVASLLNNFVGKNLEFASLAIQFFHSLMERIFQLIVRTGNMNTMEISSKSIYNILHMVSNVTPESPGSWNYWSGISAVFLQFLKECLNLKRKDLEAPAARLMNRKRISLECRKYNRAVLSMFLKFFQQESGNCEGLSLLASVIYQEFVFANILDVETLTKLSRITITSISKEKKSIDKQESQRCDIQAPTLNLFECSLSIIAFSASISFIITGKTEAKHVLHSFLKELEGNLCVVSIIPAVIAEISHHFIHQEPTPRSSLSTSQFFHNMVLIFSALINAIFEGYESAITGITDVAVSPITALNQMSIIISSMKRLVELLSFSISNLDINSHEKHEDRFRRRFLRVSIQIVRLVCRRILHYFSIFNQLYMVVVNSMVRSTVADLKIINDIYEAQLYSLLLVLQFSHRSLIPNLSTKFYLIAQILVQNMKILAFLGKKKLQTFPNQTNQLLGRIFLQLSNLKDLEKSLILFFATILSEMTEFTVSQKTFFPFLFPIYSKLTQKEKNRAFQLLSESGKELMRDLGHEYMRVYQSQDR